MTTQPNNIVLNDRHASGGSIQIYEGADGAARLEVRLEDETVWVTADQLSALFAREKSTISRHLRNVFADGELQREAVVANFATTASDGKTYSVAHYNLDVVISVGYRVKSHEGVRFRRWATSVLRDYLLTGVAIDRQRLEQLGKVVQILSRSADEMASGISSVLAAYLPGLTLLRDYDAGHVDAAPEVVPNWQLTIDEARAIIRGTKAQFPNDTLFGSERGGGLESVIGAVYQGFAGQDAYPTVEEKAANLLYLVVKDHPLSDGNKRTAAALFVTFLAKNGLLYRDSGIAIIDNGALAALTLLVANSDPREKELLVHLIIRVITGEN
ncbi:MAG: RhuM family protein [Pseudoclavibacter sp.]